MEAEYKDNYGEQYYPATLDLNRELAWAIQEGGLDRIVAALEDQSKTLRPKVLAMHF